MTVRVVVPALAVVLGAMLVACTPEPDLPTPMPVEPTGTPPAGDPSQPPDAGPDLQVTGDYAVEVVDVLEMDPGYFTQGLEFLDDGTVVLSSGRYGESSISVLNVTTGEVLATQDLGGEFFGEGATVVGDIVHQITWRENTVLTWHLPELTPGEQFSYDGEGWGLCLDEGRDVLWRTDGSALLFAHDPQTWELLDEVLVHDADGTVERLNELECVDGMVWANVFTTDEVLHIDPASGEVLGSLDMAALTADAEEANASGFDRNQVLNGLAYDAETDRFLVTGKQWPRGYIVEITTG